MAETAKSFRQTVGVPPSTASTGDSTLVIIDAQNEYATGLLRTEGVDRTRAAIASLLGRYRAAGAPVVHVVHETPEGAPVFTSGTPLAAEFDELRPQEGSASSESVVVKHFAGSFTGTQLQEILEGTGRKKVVLTGYMAHVCVSTTARQGAERGWDVIVARDAVGDRHIPGVDAAELVRVALSEIADAFGTVLESGDISS
ncbi:Isochorismatase-like protein [Nemania sp. NC0429]|nr:Isochorismatase-like protein [Nemania sp. NC0429]